MLITAVVTTTAFAVTAIYAVKTKNIFKSVYDVVPTQCILEGKDA